MCPTQVPRVRGERVQWARSLGMEGLLARHLPLGTFADQLRGIRDMTDQDVKVALYRFMADVAVSMAAGLKALRGRSAGESQAGSAVQEHINSKFALDGAFVGKFATLDDFYKGPEGIIGTPNPKILPGMEAEHCLRGNSKTIFTTGNYNLATTPAMEWEFVVTPRAGFEYPHTPKDKGGWRHGNDWKGSCGREAEELELFMAKSQVKTAGLLEAEVIGLRLYTGPMFVLYNAVLRGFPEKDVECLKDKDSKENRYETTIFVIASGITKLSKVSAIPKDRHLYRGLGGMILPRQFWEHYPECQVTFTIAAANSAAADVLKKLEGTDRSTHYSNEEVGKDGVSQDDREAGADPQGNRSSSSESVRSEADAQQPAEVTGRARSIFDVSTVYLPIKLPVQPVKSQTSKGVRVVKEARQEGEVIRMSVALPFAKGYFMEKLQTFFQTAVRELCGGGNDVKIEAVADKPEDFRGGGALRRPD
jgi:hypothetical protein